MCAVLIPYGFWLPLALAVSTLPAFGVVLRSSVRQYRWRLEKSAEERRCWYYDWLLTAGETAAELRLFGLGSHFRAAYQDLRARLRGERLRLARDESLAELGAGVLAIAVVCLAMAWMVWQAILGRVTLGDVALLYQAFQQGLRLMRTVLKSVGQLYANSLFLSNLFAFLSLEPRVVDPVEPAPVPRQGDIQFRGVTFRYPGSERTALRDFSLTIPQGRVVALVGANGAGKSTLIKLICRLYDPEAGAITLGGVDLREFAIEESSETGHRPVPGSDPLQRDRRGEYWAGGYSRGARRSGDRDGGHCRGSRRDHRAPAARVRQPARQALSGWIGAERR